jgi:hypothetical protein
MPLKVELQEGETLIFEDGVANSDRPTVFGVTDRAIFVTREKHLARESWYLDRIPISAITQVSLLKESRFAIWGLSSMVFFGGLVLAAGLVWNVYNRLPDTRGSIWPFIWMLLGALMPFLARGRKVLVVQMGTKTYKWKPRLTLDQSNKFKVKQLQDDFLKACRSVGIHIFHNNL